MQLFQSKKPKTHHWGTMVYPNYTLFTPWASVCEGCHSSLLQEIFYVARASYVLVKIFYSPFSFFQTRESAFKLETCCKWEVNMLSRGKHHISDVTPHSMPPLQLANLVVIHSVYSSRYKLNTRYVDLFNCIFLL